jgi:putative membrane protein
MQNNYIAILLINMAAGLFIFAHYVLLGMGRTNQKGWVPAFGAVGLVAFCVGLHMTLTWPIPGKYAWANMAFGELSVLLGATFLAGALAIGYARYLLPVSLYALFAGVAAIVLGQFIATYGLTKQPMVAAAGFILTGAAGVFLPAVALLGRGTFVRIVEAVIAAAAGIIWLIIGYGAYWQHMGNLTNRGG